jgi:uncharacterized protein (TIGR02266 family)
MTDHRKYVRAPLHLAVSYRTAGSFLVAYTVNLSKGGIFIEADPLPVGTAVRLELEVPGAGRLDVEGVVTWTRAGDGSEGLPVGMGIRFAQALDARHGEAIDRIVASFEGLEILLVGSAERRAQIGRYASSILACDTVEAGSLQTAATVLRDRIDLVIVDLDTAGRDGIEIVRMARSGPSPTPVIALGGTDDAQRWARVHGITQFVQAPPTFGALQRAVLAALASPEG